MKMKSEGHAPEGSTYRKQMEREVKKAYVWVRENNSSIPDEVLDFMRDSALNAIKG